MEILIIGLLFVMVCLMAVKNFFMTKLIENMFELYQALDKRTDILFKYDDLHNKAINNILDILVEKK